MSLSHGARFNSYLIGESIGVGGMGEVYHATDTNLKRDVAIKVLPESFASDVDRLARFQREAEVLAALNHVNIAQIYGLERSAGVTALVMELVEGPTLADRLEQGPLPVDEALGIAMQIAEALEAAHVRGIVHRDLKPANIKVTADGSVKVLDFGIAKALDTRTISGSQAAQLTTPAMTEAGMILGTAAYMSPEQARGKPVDQRADIWAFGCVLYEMLTGQLAFGGEDVTTTLARILERGADMSALPQSLPSAVSHTLKLCLEKDLRKRVADIRDVKLALEGMFETVVAPSASTRGRGWVSTFVAPALAVLFAIPALQHLTEVAPPVPPETRVEISTPTSAFATEFALSPDGQSIVFVAEDAGEQRLWLRSLAATTAQPLAGTEGARLPFWAPDNRSVGFFTANALKKVDLGGGAARTLAPVISARGGTWNSQGTILFAPGASGALLQVTASGGMARAATVRLPQQQSHESPTFLPDGERFLFSARGTQDFAGIYLGALDGSEPVRLTSNSADFFRYLPSGWLLWVQDRNLIAQGLDLDHAALTGELVTLADDVSGISAAATGLVAYRSSSGNRREAIWVDRNGTVLGALGTDTVLSAPGVATDGKRVIVARSQDENVDLWLLDEGRSSRLTFDPAEDAFPLWSPDGTQLVFRSQRSGIGDLYTKPANAAGPEELLLAGSDSKTPSSWSADGRFLLYTTFGATTATDIWVLPMGTGQAPWIWQQSQFDENRPSFSPDGHWVAFQSNESGRSEVYVRPFVEPGTQTGAAAVTTGQWQVSTAGGIMPQWSPDGHELYYVDPQGAMMAALITPGSGTVELSTPLALFDARMYGDGADLQRGRQYVVSSDGRFLVNRTVDDASASPIILIQNWNPEVAQ